MERLTNNTEATGIAVDVDGTEATGIAVDVEGTEATGIAVDEDGTEATGFSPSHVGRAEARPLRQPLVARAHTQRSRRDFLKAAGLAGVGLSLAGRDAWAWGAQAQTQARTFKLQYAPHFGMFREHSGTDLVAQLEFMAAEGFTALEDNGMRGRTPADQERVAAAMQRLKMRMGVFVAHTINWNEPTLTSMSDEPRDTFLKEIEESVAVAKRVGATWMTVVPGHVDRRPHIDYQTARVVDTLKRAAAILEPHGLVMVLEPLNTLRNHPGMFLTSTPQAYLVCKAVASPACKILYDIYHQQITEGNLLPNIDRAWDEIAYFQVGDNPGRAEPGTGEINYRNVFRHIHRKGFTGIVGMEHGNSLRGRDGERAVIDAYVEADGFTPPTTSS